MAENRIEEIRKKSQPEAEPETRRDSWDGFDIPEDCNAAPDPGDPGDAPGDWPSDFYDPGDSGSGGDYGGGGGGGGGGDGGGGGSPYDDYYGGDDGHDRPVE